MSRLSKFLLVFTLAVFALACNLVTSPIKDVQNLAGTAESIASSMPAETLMALASQIPVETLQALPSALPEVNDLLNPQGTPVDEWNGIPVMPEAVAGAEVESVYSYKANVTSEAAKDFYAAQLPLLGWVEQFVQPGDTTVMFYMKDTQSLTITISPAADESRIIWLALNQ